jgi:hypothetical protein
MPLSVILALSGWVIVVALFLWVGIGSIQEGQWGGFVFWLFPASAAGTALWGMLRRSLGGWYWSRFVSFALGTLSVAPFIFAVGYIAYIFFGGAVADEMSFALSVSAFVGIFFFLPTLIFWGIYFLLNTSSAWRYCGLCPDCMSRIKAPIQIFFDDYQCERCRTAAGVSDKFEV